MLLQLPLELQQQVASCLTTSQALGLREVSRESKELASSCIRTARLTAVGDLRQMAKSFPNVTDLLLAPETVEDVLMLFESFLPDRACWFPSNLRQLSIDTTCVSYDAIDAYQVDEKTSACTDLNEIHLSAYCVNLTADVDFLRKLVSVQAIAETDPHYPAACFLSSGILGLGLASCINLRVLKTYTRTCQDTQDLMKALHGCSSLETLELRVPYVQEILCHRLTVPCPQVRRMKLVQKSHGGDFIFTLAGFPSVEFLVISLPSMVPESLVSGPLQNLKTVWLHNVTNLRHLQHAPRLTTLSLNYSEAFGSHFFEPLSLIPRLQRLEICDHIVDIEDLLTCRALKEVVLVDVIDVSEVSAALYITDLTTRDHLQSIWVQSEGTRYLFPTETFKFGMGRLTRASLEGWEGRICRPDAPAIWFGNGVARSYDLGLQLNKIV